MSTITNLEDLLVHQLRDIYSAEKQLVRALPAMVKHSQSEPLQEALSAHLDETVEQLNRLEQVFEQLGISSRGPKCRAMEGLLEETTELYEQSLEPSVLDAGLVASAQRVEHYEMAAYGTAVAYARQLGHTEAMGLLQRSLAEERQTDERLTALAEGGINALAQQGGAAERATVASDAETSEDDMDDSDDSDDEPQPRVERMRPSRTRSKADSGRRLSQPHLRVIRPH